MKKAIRVAIALIIFIAIFIALIVWGVYDETVADYFSMLGFITASAFITGCLGIFAYWLGQPDTEEKSGDNSVDEKAG